MKILIVEDEQPAARRIKKMVEELDASYTIAGTTDSIESTVEWLNENEHPDLILMDIELGDGQSFEIFNKVDVKSTIIFTTAYDEYAIRAFKVNSIDYLLKPVTDEALKNSLEKFENIRMQHAGTPLDMQSVVKALKEQQHAGFKQRFLIRHGQRFIPLEVNEISYFYTEEKVSFIRTYTDQRYMIDYSLDELEHLLDPKCYFRANRQYIISPKALESIHNHFNGKLKIMLKPVAGDEVYVSRERAADFKSWLGE